MNEEDVRELGEQEACHILGAWLLVEPAWLSHIVGRYGKCDCVHDVERGDTYCTDWQEHEDAWFKSFHGITKEQWLARQVEERLRAARAAAVQRHLTLEELAQEQGIDPKLLP